MSALRAASPAIWLWCKVAMPIARAARITGFTPGGRSIRSPAVSFDLPAGWALLQPGLPACEAASLSASTRSRLGALTWYERPLTYAR